MVVLDLTLDVDHQPQDRPRPGAVLVELGGVDEREESVAYAVAHPPRILRVAVPQHRRDLVVRVARERFRVDHQPLLTITPKDVGEVQIGMDQLPVGRLVGSEVARDRPGLLDHPRRHGKPPLLLPQLARPSRGLLRQRTQLRRSRHMQPPVEPAHDLARLHVPRLRQVLGI